jgi:hypothetical protein
MLFTQVRSKRTWGTTRAKKRWQATRLPQQDSFSLQDWGSRGGALQAHNRDHSGEHAGAARGGALLQCWRLG